VGLKEDLNRAKQNRPEPVLVDIVIGDTLYRVDARRLDGMEWAGVMAESPPTDEGSARLGFSTHRAALIACTRFSTLYDADGEPVRHIETDEQGNPLPLDWGLIFSAISGIEVQALAATWWALNAGDPNQRVVDLKKSSAGGGKTK